ncbi:MAG TPA: KH domain-containing protein [Terriglobales bacterium]
MSEQAEKLRVLAEELAKGLADSPAEVSVETVEETDDEVALELEVAERDMGRIIGKGGRTVRALRNVLTAAAEKHGKRCDLDILE